MLRRSLVVLPLALLTLAAPAQAGKITFGSDLTETATTVDRHPRDWVAWPTRTVPSSKNGYVAPAQGEVTQVSFKGTVPKPPNDAAYRGRYPDFVFHVVVLHPSGNGANEVTVATQNLDFPMGGDPQQITTFDLQKFDARICVRKGDIVALATSGGFGNQYPEFGAYPDDYFSEGYPLQMFHRGNAGASYERYKLPADGNHENNWYLDVGDHIRGDEVKGIELLMRTTVGTGADARYFCRTKDEQKQNLPNPGQPPTSTGPSAPAPAPATTSDAAIPVPAHPPRVKGKKLKVTLFCPGPKPCTGKLSLRLYSGRAKAFLIAPGKKAVVTVTLNKSARRKLTKRGAGLTVKAMVRHPDGSHTVRRFVIRRG